MEELYTDSFLHVFFKYIESAAVLNYEFIMRAETHSLIDCSEYECGGSGRGP